MVLLAAQHAALAAASPAGLNPALLVLQQQQLRAAQGQPAGHAQVESLSSQENLQIKPSERALLMQKLAARTVPVRHLLLDHPLVLCQ